MWPGGLLHMPHSAFALGVCVQDDDDGDEQQDELEVLGTFRTKVVGVRYYTGHANKDEVREQSAVALKLLGSSTWTCTRSWRAARAVPPEICPKPPPDSRQHPCCLAVADGAPRAGAPKPLRPLVGVGAQAWLAATSPPAFHPGRRAWIEAAQPMPYCPSNSASDPRTCC